MDGGDAASTRRLIGSCTGGSNCKPIINPIMMRFRPIAPKPLPGGSIPSSLDSKNNNSSISKGRTKRKYVRVRRYNRKKKTTTRNNHNNSTTEDGELMDHDQTAVTTLQLLPVIGGGGGSENKTETGRRMMEKEMRLVSDPKGGVGVELWVTVECVTDACMDLELREGEIGCTDEERIKNLEKDTCPGFVSDGMNRVEWLNKAFKRMVWQRQRNNNDNKSKMKKEEEGGKGDCEGDCESPAEVSVWLISKPKLPNMRRVFTCQIKLQFKRGTEMEKDSRVVPCDAWRMDGGGFAWKLDVKAALTLAPLLQEDFD
ncbi:hypothetical protein IC582_004427 [Cucumis melo]|uniref:Uncharacterized protein LOC103485503 n=1 Tax=Cucumis melo TaxID=3656 RepID=A0A1S3B3A6_CUCME|nr:uncharacterized protein LOC103485503 [Cucumis melo]